MAISIDEAIERLETCLGGWPMVEIESYMDAIKLGKEALKYYKKTHIPPSHPGYVRLKGETA